MTPPSKTQTSGSGTRRPLVAANWKMHLLRQEAERFCTRLREGLPELSREVDCVVFPGFTLLPAVAERLAGSPAAWGGQNLHPEAEGAHTGEVSGPQLADVGCSWVLCGHSERRRDCGETNAAVGAKALAARHYGLRPMICLGETAAERRDGRTFAVLEEQLAAALAGGPDLFALAYEPVWAIGTGETATPETAQEAHAFLRRALAERLGEAAAAGVRILYGGSVKPANAAELIAPQDVDGFLVGGAGLDPESFLGIMARCGSGS